MADAEPETEHLAIEACPDCGSSQIYSRMTVSPRYRCTRCGHEFHTPTRRRTGEGPASQ